MLKRYLLITDGNINSVYSSEDMATKEGMILFKNKKIEHFSVQIINIKLFDTEILKLYQQEIECYDILSDLLYILHNEYAVSENYDKYIENDIAIIYHAYLKKSDADRSHWDNIRSTIDYLQDIECTNFDYLNLHERK